MFVGCLLTCTAQSPLPRGAQSQRAGRSLLPKTLGPARGRGWTQEGCLWPGPLVGPQEALEAGAQPPGSEALRHRVGSCTLLPQTRSLHAAHMPPTPCETLGSLAGARLHRYRKQGPTSGGHGFERLPCRRAQRTLSHRRPGLPRCGLATR